MNIAITGATGFIGNNLKVFLKEFDEVNLILINRTKQNNKTQNEYTYEEFFNKEVNDNIDIFIHLASPNFDKEKNGLLHEGIFNLTKKIMENLYKYNCTKFIYFSSAKVYGESRFDKETFFETTSTYPISDYAKTKLATEKLIIEKSKKENFHYLIFRLPFVYGAGMKSNLNMIFKIIEKSLPVFVFDDDMDMKKSFLSIHNINNVIKMIIANKSSYNQIFNLSDHEPISLSSMIRAYKKTTNSKSILITINKRAFDILKNIPILSSIIKKVFGNFILDNSKISSFYDGKLISTYEGLQHYSNTKI